MVRFNMDRIVWFYNIEKWLPFYDTAATFVYFNTVCRKQ